MSEPTPTGTESQSGPEGGEGGNAYTPPATQADLDRIISERVARTKNQFKDYADLKAKAEQFDQQQLANQSEAERQAQELARWQSEAEKWRTASVAHRIEALAATEFADPSDAATALADPARYLDAGGQINEDAIKADLADVLARKPHWRRQEGTPAPRVPAPNPNQGSGTAGTPASSPANELAAILQSQLNGSR
jgi:hypothetical protein